MPKRSKKPKKVFSPASRKEPRIAPQNEPDSIMHDKPKWRVSYIDYEGPWGFNGLGNKEKLIDILDKLRNFEGMRWNEIPPDRHHLIPITRICKEAKERLAMIGKDDYQDLFSFSLSGRERLWGIRQHEAFYILWWDPDHSVCPSLKKHT